MISLDNADVCLLSCYGVYKSFLTIIFSYLWNYCPHRNLWQGKVEAAVHQFDGQGRLPRPNALAMARANHYSRDNVNSKIGWGREWILWAGVF